MFKSLLLAAAFLQLAGCAVLDPNDVLTRRLGNAAPANGQPLDMRTREQAFDFVWNRVNDRYVDPQLRGVNWKAVGQQYRPLALAARHDDMFWDTLDRMTGELGDAHTRVMSSQQYTYYKNKQFYTLGLAVREMNGELVVVRVGKESPAAQAGIVAGAVLLEIDGKPATQWWQATTAASRKNSTERARQKSVLRVLNAGHPDAPSATLALRVQGLDGSAFATTLTRAIAQDKPSVSSKILPSGYGYLRLSAFDDRIKGDLVKQLSSLRSSPGIVIDLRGNGGGKQHIAQTLMNTLVEGKVAAGKTLTRTGKPLTMFMGMVDLNKPELTLQGVPDPYRGQVVLLVDEASASASELTAATLQGIGRAKVVGEVSCGCLLGYMGPTNVPGGGALVYSELDFETVDGRRIEGTGVIPDVRAALTRADLVAGRDPVLEAATALLTASRPVVASH